MARSRLGQAVTDFGSTARSVELGLRAEQQHELLAGRVEQMVAELLFRANHSVAEAQRGIIFLDEIDKLARRTQSYKTGGGTRDIGGEGVQQGPSAAEATSRAAASVVELRRRAQLRAPARQGAARRRARAEGSTRPTCGQNL